MSDDYEYFKNKRSDRVYLSRSLSQKQYRMDESGAVQELIRPFRVVSKVIDCAESHEFFKDGKQVSLRITGGARQEVVAKFYEDTRGVFTGSSSTSSNSHRRRRLLDRVAKRVARVTIVTSAWGSPTLPAASRDARRRACESARLGTGESKRASTASVTAIRSHRRAKT